MARSFRDMVVVITGASSGIGRACAHALAERGATLVLAARSHDALRAVAEECGAAGGRALPVVTDVGDENQVRHLAERALGTYGRIDVWINDAAVTLFGRIEELPPGAFERVIRTNLLGYAYGARAAIPAFREQGQGILINVASVVAWVGQPFTSAYVASKWAIRGLSECLRMELMDAPRIHCCTVYPPSIDTPLFQHGGNYHGRVARPMPPVHPPEEVADVVLGLIAKPRREAFVGAESRMAAFGHAMASAAMERMMARKVEQDHFEDRPAPPSAGNLVRPMWDAVHGGWRQGAQQRRGEVSTATAVAGAALAAAIPIGLMAWREMQRRARTPARHIRH